VLASVMRWAPQSLYDRMAVRYSRRTGRIAGMDGK
jgi:hypothetical protein